MLTDEILERVVERLTSRIEEANTYIVQEMGKTIKKIKTVTPSEARRLEQILKYGGDYDKIKRKLAQVTKLNLKDIEQIFQEVAKRDYEFAEKFYAYKKKKYIPFDENTALKAQVKALAGEAAKEYVGITQTEAVGMVLTDLKGKKTFKKLQTAYNDMVDTAVMSVVQGKSSMGDEIQRLVKKIGGNGLKSLNFENGRTMRLDSAIKMQMRGAIRNLHNQIQEQLGEEFGADGVEITVHLNPAPDHAKVQGRQFSNEEFEKFQTDQDSVSYDGVEFPAESEETGRDRRSISEYNCYHYIFAIVLGISEPEYTDKQLQEIIDRSEKGFEYDGKQYTTYEGTQLQRQIETEIRRQKDIQIMAREADEPDVIDEAQKKITVLNRKYKEVSAAAGLPTKANRLRVSGYQRTAVKKG
jgi:hypothetical protein